MERGNWLHSVALWPPPAHRDTHAMAHGNTLTQVCTHKQEKDASISLCRIFLRQKLSFKADFLQIANLDDKVLKLALDALCQPWECFLFCVAVSVWHAGVPSAVWVLPIPIQALPLGEEWLTSAAPVLSWVLDLLLLHPPTAALRVWLPFYRWESQGGMPRPLDLVRVWIQILSFFHSLDCGRLVLPKPPSLDPDSLEISHGPCVCSCVLHRAGADLVFAGGPAAVFLAGEQRFLFVTLRYGRIWAREESCLQYSF